MTPKSRLWLTIAALVFVAILAALFMSGVLHGAVNFILHIDRHLTELSAQYGGWIYAILFAKRGWWLRLSCPAILCFLPQAALPHWAA